jgi:hypothetical protein
MLILEMNSLVLFHFPLKVGHVPKRLAGVAIVGGSVMGESGGIGDPGSLGESGTSSGMSSASLNSSSKGSEFLSCSGCSSIGSNSSRNFPCATKDSSVKGLNTDSETRSLESVSC